MMLALFKDGEHVKDVVSGSAMSVDLVYVSHATDGWSFGPYRLELKEEQVEVIVLPEPTPEELRALMPNKSMVEFRAALRSIRTEAVPNGIYAADIEAKISEIVDLDLQEEARDYFNLGQYAERLNPWIDILGTMFGMTSEEIDILW